ncbi:MAG: hypothetical protein AAFZ07_20325 [Actinomycetota bacterium]
MTRVEEVPLDFTNLAHLDNGRIDKLLRRHLAIVAMDCINRPSDDGNRTVSLKFNVSPVLDPDTGDAESCKLEVECTSGVPKFRSKTFEMRLQNNGLTFNRDFPGELDQPPLFDGDEER